MLRGRPLRRQRITQQHRSQGLLERLEPRLVMLPVIDTITINRLAHLLGTGSAHSAVVFVKTQTALIERQATVIQQPAYFAVGVLDHGFVNHPMHTARQHRVAVRHQLDIVAVVPADVLEVYR